MTESESFGYVVCASGKSPAAVTSPLLMPKRNMECGFIFCLPWISADEYVILDGFVPLFRCKLVADQETWKTSLLERPTSIFHQIAGELNLTKEDRLSHCHAENERFLAQTRAHQ